MGTFLKSKILEWSDVPDSCNDDFDFLFINNHLVRPQESCIQNFKFLPIQEVTHLLIVFDASLKEAKMTFLIPDRMIFILFSSIII